MRLTTPARLLLALLLVAALPAGRHPFALAVTPCGSRLLALNVESDDVTIFDTATRQPLATVPVGRAPYGVAIDAAGRRAFVTNQQGASVSVIDLASLTVAATWPTAEYPEGIAWDAARGGRLWVVSWMEDAVALHDAATGRPTGRVAVGRNPRAFGTFLAERR